MRACGRRGVPSSAKDYQQLGEDGQEAKGDDADWKLDDLKEVDERLATFIENSGAAPFAGTDFVRKYEEEKAAEVAGTQGPEPEEDPYNAFGFGILEYFKLLQDLMYVYIVICVLLIPVWLKYHEGGALAGLRGSTALTELTLGNLGFAEY